MLSPAELDALTGQPAARRSRYAELVRAHYAGATDLYRWIWGDSFHFAVDGGDVVGTEHRLAELGRFRGGDSILDVGCGIGGPALNIAEHVDAHVTGIDLVERHVEIARARAAERGLTEQTSFRVGDAMLLPFPDGSFDHVYSIEAGCHTPDKRRFVSECARVLRPGGAFVGLDWVKGTDLEPQSETLVEAVCAGFALPSLVDCDELARHMTAASLRVVHMQECDARLPDARPLPAGLAGDATARLLAGARAISAAVEAGAFALALWCAARPRVS